MKLDGEAVLFRGTVDCKPDQEPLGDNNAAMSEHRLETKEQSGAFCVMKSGEGKTDRLPYVFSDEDRWAIRKLDCSMCADDLTNDEEKLRHFVAPIPLSRSSLEVESFEKDSVFYVDKSVMEPELPELVVCYKENTYQIVKDICIDDGVPSKDKFLFDTDLDEQKLCTFFTSEEKNSELAQGKGDREMQIPELQESSTKENLGIGHPIPDNSISSEKKGSRSEFPVKHDLKDLMPMGDVEQDAMKEVTKGTSKEFLSLGELLSMSEMHAGLSQPKSSHDTVNDVEQLAQRPHVNTILTWSHVSEESENVNEQLSLANPTTKESSFGFGCEQASLQIHGPDSAVKVPDHGHDGTCISSPPESSAEEYENGSKEKTLESHNIDDVVYEPNRTAGDKFENSRLKTGSITCDSNSSATAASRGGKGEGEGEGSQTGGCGHPQDQDSSRPEAFSSQLEYCQGESSFSAAGVPISGLISYSGPIAYSGSLSLRSDSSTTSTRSFAFPVLQSEWNNSPVRMAKAERRCMRKQRGWRQAILCCRF